jgi:arylformamidase
VTRRVVDLTLPLHNGMPTYPVPWHPLFEMVQLGRHAVEGRESRRVTIGTHTGTHCDAPAHLVPGGATLESLPLEVLVGPATVVDLTSAGERAELDARVLAEALGERRPERLLLRYGWSTHWGTMKYFTDHPFLSEAAGRLLVERGVRLLGFDTPTPDNPLHGRGHDPDSPVHKLLLGAGVVLVEYLCNLEALRGQEVELVVLPLKLEGADGAPVRCVAIE